MPTVRITLGYFQPAQTQELSDMLSEVFRASLEPAIRRLKGNISYYVAIDRQKHCITNISVWASKEDAMQMASLRELLDMRRSFEALGVSFIDISNNEVLWQL